MSYGKIIEGVLRGNERGYAFLLPTDTSKEDYFIPHSDLKGAMHGDTVLCETTNGGGHRTTARVLKVINRGITELVGTYFSCRSGGYVVPDDKKYFCDVFIPFGNGVRAKSGDKVVCKILFYPKKQNPEGLVKKILGRQFTKSAELKSILYTYNLPESFPEDVVKLSNSFLGHVTKEEIKGRRDYRNLTTFTIDGDDAKDFDDAVSIERIDGERYLLGVHIADVSHYVKQGDAIDREAFERATSVYFPESVIPMLPEKLCNDLCSLREGVDRLTLSCMMTVDKKGNVIDSLITPSVIRSRARLTYTNVQKIFDGDKELLERYSFISDELFAMNELSDILIEKRDINGSVDLDVKESTISVLSDGQIVVTAGARDKAHRLIEEFMILANCTVAEYMFYLDKPFVYRIHDKPTEERLENFYSFIKGVGINAKRSREGVYPKDFQLILKNAENTPAYTVINRVMLRSMQKAKYSPEDIGHFGLSAKHYCHFTSPIRRYPDLLIHRIIKDFLNGQDVEKEYGDYVYTASTMSSEKERNAIEAERAVDDFYKILYISNFEGEEFDAVISGVTGFGLFAELANGIEGIIKLETLYGSRYKFDEKSYTLSNGKTTFRLGQPIRICVAGVNIGDRRAEFILVNKDNRCKNG